MKRIFEYTEFGEILITTRESRCMKIRAKTFKMIPILRIFLQPPLISLKCNKNIGNFLVRSAFQSDKPRTFKCMPTQCETCPFIRNVEKISGPKRSIKITDHFTCTSANVIYCATCILCKSYALAKQGDN